MILDLEYISASFKVILPILPLLIFVLSILSIGVIKLPELVKKTPLKLVEKSFTHKQLLEADEVFLTSSGSFITPILKIDKKKINNGKIGNITLKLAEMYSKSCLHG